MKKISFIITAVIALSLSLNAFTLGKLGEFKFKKVTKNVWIMHGPPENPSVENEGFMNNPSFVEGKNGTIVIDPGGNYNVGKKIVAEYKKVTKKPVLAILNTHKHGDHWFAGKAFQEAFPNAQSYAHPNMIKAAKDGEARVWYNILEGLSKNLKGTDGPFPFPTKVLKDGDVLKVDGQTFRVFHPERAHTDTDILIEHVESNTLWLGDNLMDCRLGGMDESSSIYGNIELLEDILAQKKGYKKYDLYVPGHGPSGEMHKTIDPFLNYFKVVLKWAQKGYADGKESYEVKPDASAELKDYHNWDEFERQMGKHLMKAYSEVEEKDK
ncbi:MBL fold metallo-hydrolase [Sulfurimonas sp.]|uniref:MBL fold metallo-hydrolase n=1 Tax=Sulfurimonas sp. TaxID=2022749 RepID=UPI0025F405E5|nr:MBL fold metallo-hydrolase [Sulfurimonas sp.]MDD5157694.1 MBL fold metallo-hydrolase [Sulfurimonas sp.]